MCACCQGVNGVEELREGGEVWLLMLWLDEGGELRLMKQIGD